MKTERIIQRIDQLSEKQGISRNKMLQACGLSKSVVDNLKKGSMPSADKIEAMADFFGVSTDYLLGKTDIPKIQTQSLDTLLSELDQPEQVIIMRKGKDGGQEVKTISQEKYDRILKLLEIMEDPE